MPDNKEPIQPGLPEAEIPSREYLEESANVLKSEFLDECAAYNKDKQTSERIANEATKKVIELWTKNGMQGKDNLGYFRICATAVRLAMEKAQPPPINVSANAHESPSSGVPIQEKRATAQERADEHVLPGTSDETPVVPPETVIASGASVREETAAVPALDDSHDTNKEVILGFDPAKWSGTEISPDEAYNRYCRKVSGYAEEQIKLLSQSATDEAHKKGAAIINGLRDRILDAAKHEGPIPYERRFKLDPLDPDFRKLNLDSRASETAKNVAAGQAGGGKEEKKLTDFSQLKDLREALATPSAADTALGKEGSAPHVSATREPSTPPPGSDVAGETATPLSLEAQKEKEIAGKMNEIKKAIEVERAIIEDNKKKGGDKKAKEDAEEKLDDLHHELKDLALNIAVGEELFALVKPADAEAAKLYRSKFPTKLSQEERKKLETEPGPLKDTADAYFEGVRRKKAFMKLLTEKGVGGDATGELYQEWLDRAGYAVWLRGELAAEIKAGKTDILDGRHPDSDSAEKALDWERIEAEEPKEVLDELTKVVERYNAVPPKEERPKREVAAEKEGKVAPLYARVLSGEVDIKTLPPDNLAKLAEHKDEGIKQMAQAEIMRREREEEEKKQGEEAKKRAADKKEGSRISPLQQRILDALNNNMGETIPRDTLEKKENARLPEVAEYLAAHPLAETVTPVPTSGKEQKAVFSNRDVERLIDSGAGEQKGVVAEDLWEVRQGRKQNKAASKKEKQGLAGHDEEPLSPSQIDLLSIIKNNEAKRTNRTEDDDRELEALWKIYRAEENKLSATPDEVTTSSETPTLKEVPLPNVFRGNRIPILTDVVKEGPVTHDANEASPAVSPIIFVEAPPSPEKPEEFAEIAAVTAEITSMTPEERESAGFNLQNFGFQLEKGKSKLFAGTYGFVADNLEEKGAMGRFFNALRTQFVERGEQMDERMRTIAEQKKSAQGSGLFSNLTNIGYFTGNMLKYGRIASDLVGWTAMAPLRGVMLGSTIAASGLEAAKEARLENEEVREKTRIQDMDKAAEEAWAIYERAMRKGGLNPKTAEYSNISADELRNAYRAELPKDILARLEQSKEVGTGSGLVHRVFQKHIMWAAERMQNKLNDIEGNTVLSPEEKERQKDILLSRFGRSKMLNDFDRMVSQQGFVDTLAMSSRYGSQAAKAVVYGMMAQSVYQLWDHFSESFASGSHETPANVIKPAGGVTPDLTQYVEPTTAAHLDENPDSYDSEAFKRGQVPTNSPFLALAPNEEVATLDQVAGNLGGSEALPPFIVESGDNFTKILKEYIPEIENLPPKGQENAIQNLLRSLSEDEKTAIGLGSDPNKLMVGQKLDLNKVVELLHEKKIGGEDLIEHAHKLGETAAPEIIAGDTVAQPPSTGASLGAEIPRPADLPLSMEETQKVWSELPDEIKYPQSEIEATRYLTADIEKLFPKPLFAPVSHEWLSLRVRNASALINQLGVNEPVTRLGGSGELSEELEWPAVTKIQQYIEEQGLTRERGYVLEEKETLEDFLKRALAEKVLKEGPSRPFAQGRILR